MSGYAWLIKNLWFAEMYAILRQLANICCFYRNCKGYSAYFIFTDLADFHAMAVVAAVSKYQLLDISLKCQIDRASLWRRYE
jgi:hypothetical protein